MTPGTQPRAVFDCPVYAQAIINPCGPAAECLVRAQRGDVTVFVSDYVLQEIRELPSKIKPQLGVTVQAVERLIQDLGKYAKSASSTPSVYSHPIDPDDSHYIDLAVATGSRLIVSRDRHLLNLMDTSRKESRGFRMLFPTMQILDPVEFIRELNAAAGAQGNIP